MSRWFPVALAITVATLAGCTGDSRTTPNAEQTTSTATTVPSAQPFASLRASTKALDAANGPPRLTVQPSSGLRGGQQIIVNARGFWPGAKLFFSECPPGLTPSRTTGCGDQVATEVFAITDDSGAVVGYRLKVTAKANGKPCRPRCVLAAIGEPDHLATAVLRFSH